MNHILLPDFAGNNKDDTGGRYGVHAMEILINSMLKLGASRKRIRAKAFGGGNVLAIDEKTVSPGEKNIAFLLDYLRIENIPLVAKDLGGSYTRVLFFHTDSFEAYVKKTDPSIRRKLLAKEAALKKTISKTSQKSGDIILFD